MQERTDRMIRRVTTVALLAVVAFTGYLVTSILRVDAGSAPVAVDKAGGKTTMKEFVKGAKHTVLIYARSTCAACQTSKPAMKMIAATVRKRSDQRVYLMATLGPQQSELRMAEEIGLSREEVLDVSKYKLRVRSVPTFLIVDKEGVVEFVQVGTPDATRLAELLKVLTS